MSESNASTSAPTVDLDSVESASTRSARGTGTDRRGKPRFSRGVAWAVLVIVMLASLFPVYWALRTSLSTNNAIIDDTTSILPPEFTTFNYERVFTDVDTLSPEERADFQQRVAEIGGNDVNFKIWEPLITSITVSTIITVGQVFFCAMAAYAFARLKFRGREVVFTVFLSALMIPPIFALIPNILLIREKAIDLWFIRIDLGWLPWGDEQGGWTSTIPGLVAPFVLMTPFAIFFLRQFFIGISKEVEEAAVLDGAGHARRFFQVILPMAAAPIFTLALITYVNSWNEFLWPFQASRNLPTITVALNDFRAQTPGTTRPDWTGLMTGTFIAGAPILILFALLGRRVVDSIQFSGIK